MVKPRNPYDSGNLMILGVIHRDREGATLLAAWLERWAPEVVTLEFSSYGLRYRQTKGGMLKARVRDVASEMRSEGTCVNEGALEAVLAYLEEPFEFAVASAYTAARGFSLFLVDGDPFSRKRLADVEELVSRDNLKKLLSGPSPEDSTQQRALARLCLDHGLSVLPYTEEMGVRDREMTHRIATLMEAHKGARFLHVCGWQHLQDPFDLYSPFNPTKAFIYDEAPSMRSGERDSL